MIADECISDTEVDKNILINAFGQSCEQLGVVRQGKYYLLSNLSALVGTNGNERGGRSNQIKGKERERGLLVKLESLEVLPFDSLEWNLLHRKHHVADSHSFYIYALANACLPHTKEAILSEMVAITIKNVVETLSRQVLLSGGGGRDIVEELKNTRYSLINRILDTNNDEAMDVWSEVRMALEQTFPTSVVSVADIQALPKDVLKRSILYHCNQDDSLVVRPVHSLMADDNSLLLLWDIVLRMKQHWNNDLEGNVMNLVRSLVNLGGVCQTGEERAHLSLQLYHIDRSMSVKLLGDGIADGNNHPANILIDKSFKNIIPPSHPLHIILKQQEVNGLAKGDPRILTILQQALSLSIKSLGRSHAITRHLVISLAHWHHLHGSPSDAIIFYADAVKMNELHGHLTTPSCYEGVNERDVVVKGSSSSTSALMYLMACCEERREEIEQAQVTCQRAILLLTSDDRTVNNNEDTLLKSLLVMQARLALTSYCQHYVGQEKIGILNKGNNGNNKESDDVLVEDTKFACLLGLPAHLPLLTSTATEMLSTALYAYRHLLLLHSKNPNTTGADGVNVLLRKQIVGLSLRMSQGSQRILIDSLISSINARKNVPKTKLFLHAQGNDKNIRNSIVNEQMTREWLERVENIVESGTSEELVELTSMVE